MKPSSDLQAGPLDPQSSEPTRDVSTLGNMQASTEAIPDQDTDLSFEIPLDAPWPRDYAGERRQLHERQGLIFSQLEFLFDRVSDPHHQRIEDMRAAAEITAKEEPARRLFMWGNARPLQRPRHDWIMLAMTCLMRSSLAEAAATTDADLSDATAHARDAQKIIEYLSEDLVFPKPGGPPSAPWRILLAISIDELDSKASRGKATAEETMRHLAEACRDSISYIATTRELEYLDEYGKPNRVTKKTVQTAMSDARKKKRGTAYAP